MDPKYFALVQGALGVLCVVLAVVFLSKPQYLAVYTVVSGFGCSLIGNAFTGPNQVTRAKADEMVAKASIRPPADL